ncbi:ABC transporter substrate-binding protein [Halalkalibacter flavus]|uniref:ABC transporter substrate-binding protein n=1 Tax=Halalkalibacter flavus TaxID=3090668 RepID=UPI002FC6BE7B
MRNHYLFIKTLRTIVILIIVCTGCKVAPSKVPDFNWKVAEGETIKIALNQHPYAYAILKELPRFQEKTGIEVSYTISPEEYYADRITYMLHTKTGNPDVFMTGSYYIWSHASNGLMQDLDELMSNHLITNPDLATEDFHPTVLNTLKWDLVPGNPVGTGKTWALPIGFEIISLAYNKQWFSELNINPPKTLSELKQQCSMLNDYKDDDTYALGLRGTNKWTGLTTGYITSFVNNGAKDFKIVNGKLISTVNSQEAIEFTDQWAELIKKCVPPEWASYPWYEAGGDLGAGRTGMLFDADNNAYYQNQKGNSTEAGNIAWTLAPLANEGNNFQSNIWTWGLGINEYSTQKKASWLFVQYFTSKEFIKKGALELNLVNPARNSVLKDPKFVNLLQESEGYTKTLNETLENANELFTPHPNFFEMSNEWSLTLQKIVLGEYQSSEEGLNALKLKIDNILKADN